MNTTTDDLAKVAEETGRAKLALEVCRWLNQNLHSIPHSAQAELLRILGVPIL